MIFLLDVNVLIAMFDERHVFHASAQSWFAAVKDRRWATCPITQNGVLRIMGNPSYPNSVDAPAMIVPAFRNNLAHIGHEFWPDDVSLLDTGIIDSVQLVHSRHITDVYLLALAVKNGGRFATFDRRISTAAVRGGAVALHIIPVIAPIAQ